MSRAVARDLVAMMAERGIVLSNTTIMRWVLRGDAASHRALKRRCASMLGFKSFQTAAMTLAGVELAHRIHKRPFSSGRADRR